MKRLEFNAQGGSPGRDEQWERRPGSQGARNAVLAAALLVAGGLYSRDQGRPFLRAPASVNFGAVNVGAGGLAAAIPLRNVGLGALQIGSITASGPEAADFTIADDGCSGSELGPGQSCLVGVQFEAAGAGLRMAELAVVTTEGASSQTIGLRGEGIQSLVARVAPAQLDFGGQRLGTTSPIQLARLRNESERPLRVESIEWREFAEDFQIVHESCSGNELEAGGECEIGVEFTPSAQGARSAIVAIGTAGDGSFMLRLDGSGVAAGETVVEIFPRTVDFGAKDSGAPSPALPVTIRVRGDEAVTVSGARIAASSAGFSVTGDECSSRTLSDGQECTLQVRFDETAAGEHAARLEVRHSLSSDPEVIAMHGEVRREVNWSVQVSPDPLDFGEQTLGTTAGSRVVQLKNLSTGNLEVDRIALAGTSPEALRITDDGCGGRQFVPNGGCEIRIGFAPGAAGEYRASLRFDFRSPLPPRVVEIRGTAKAPAPRPAARLVVDPDRIDFGSRPPDETSDIRTVAVANKGNAAASITSARATGLDAPDFEIRANGCSARSLGAGQSCAIEIAFVGKIAGKRLAALEVASDSGGGPLAVSLNGEVLRVLRPAQFSLSPGRITFPAVKQDERAPRAVLVLSNEGESPGRVIGSRLGGENPQDFLAGTESCNGRTLGPGESCRIQVAFTGREAGRSSATLEIEHDGANAALIAMLEGELIRAPDLARLVVRPGKVVFAPRNAGERPVGSVVTVSNEGQSPARISSLVLGGANPNDFVVANQDCSGRTIPAGSQCQLEVALIRRQAGRSSGVLQISHDAPGSVLAVALSGDVLPTLAPANLQFVPARLTMGPFRPEDRARGGSLTLRNDGQAPARVAAVRLEGPNPGDFAIANENCSGRILAGGERCVVEVFFTGSRPGDSIAALAAAYEGANGVARAVIAARLERTPRPTGPAEFTVSPPRLGFQAAGIGSSAPPQEVAVFNAGESPGRITAVSLVGNEGNFFAVVNDGCRGAQLVPNGSCRILVSFFARTFGDRAAALRIDHDAPGPALQVSLQGNVNQPPAQPPHLRIEPPRLQFGGTFLRTASRAERATIINDGGSGTIVRGVQLRGPSAGEFTVLSDACTGRPLPPSGSCGIAIGFSPTGAGTRSAVLAVEYEGGNPAGATLFGLGPQGTPPGVGDAFPPRDPNPPPAKVCPDPAAVLFRPSLVRRDSDFAGTVRLQGALRNEGDPFQSRPGQQSLQIVEVPIGGGGGRVLQNVPFGSLQPQQTVAISANIAWKTTNEFPPSYRLVIVYDPDIAADGNPSNDDCNGANNMQSITAQQINALFSPPRPQVQPRLPRRLRQQPTPRIN